MNLKEFTSKLTEQDLKKLNEIFYKKKNKTPIYQYSKISDRDLDKLVDIEKNIHTTRKFHPWFHYQYDLQEMDDSVLKSLIKKNSPFMSDYNEEDLKANFIIPLLNHVDFFLLDKRIRSFYEEQLSYKTDQFIFRGKVDFIVAKGFKRPKEPYFFIQEFKKGKENSDPEPQLLAELISAVEMNNIVAMKGAYIIGAIWNFVILEKLGQHKYQYFISENFDCTKFNDLSQIYKNLLFIKNEIIQQ